MVIFVLILPIIIGFMGLIFDVGYLYRHKRIMQTAAAAAAMAGAQTLKRKDFANVNTYSLYDAGKNSFDGSGGETRTVNHPPLSGDFAADTDFVEVIITEQVPTFFMGLFGQDTVAVSARGVAGLLPASICVWVLDPSAARAFDVGDEASVSAQCGVVVNSDHPQALYVWDESCLDASSISVVGNYSGGCISPDPETDGFPGDDPLGDLAPPPYGGCDYTNMEINSGVATLNPGVYCGGIVIRDESQVILNPGNYILNGGGLTVVDESSIQGDGVSFYNTSSSGTDYQPIQIQDESGAQLSAPASGPMAGILFFTDRNAPSDQVNRIADEANSRFEGALYFPTQELVLLDESASGQSSPDCRAIIARKLQVNDESGLAINDDFASCPSGAPPILQPTLVE